MEHDRIPKFTKKRMKIQLHKKVDFILNIILCNVHLIKVLSIHFMDFLKKERLEFLDFSHSINYA